MRWPTLISLSTAATGLSLVTFPIDSLLRHRSFMGFLADRIAYTLAVAAIVAFIVLSVFIYLARLWAFRALIVALICSVVAIIISSVSQEMRTSGGDVFVRVGGYIIVLLLPLSALGVMFQPDVVRAFPPKRQPMDSEPRANT